MRDTYSSAKVSEGRCSRSMNSSSNSASIDRLARVISEGWKPVRLTRSISSTTVSSACRMRPGNGAKEMLRGFRAGTGCPVSVDTMKKFLGPFGSTVNFKSRELNALWKRSSVRFRRKPSIVRISCFGRLQSNIPCAKLNSGSVLLATSTPGVSGTAYSGRSGGLGSRASGSISPGGMSKSSQICLRTPSPSKSPTATTAMRAGW
mmetsp:Transcript_66420/g.203270  ORF Transcript_66420/g.203270 Transcript_66420/m.203270 type:complete len:205 (-) Transcript_66420:605-1219(-)